MRSLSISCAALLCAGLAMAQSAGTISGTGNYTIAELPAGTYDVSVAASGFKKEVRPGVEVVAQTTFRVDFTLQVGANSELVTVTAEAPLLKTESGELSHNVTTASMDSLP